MPVTGRVITSWKLFGPETVELPTKVPFGWRMVTSTPTGIVLPEIVIVIFWPAVAVKLRTAFSPIVPIVTSVDWPIAVVPVLSGTVSSRNVSWPVPTSRGSTVIV